MENLLNRAHIKRIAQEILDGKKGLIAATRELLGLLHRIQDLDVTSKYAELIAFDSETDHLPVGKVREHWAEASLAEKDKEIAKFEAAWRSDVDSVAKRLVQDFSELRPCSCCGYATLKNLAEHEICAICRWEDDGQDNRDADEVRGGPNSHLSLTQARLNFLQTGISCSDKFKRVRIFHRTATGQIAESITIPSEIESRFFAGEVSDLTRFGINASVRVKDGPHKGKVASVISLLRLEPYVEYSIELADCSAAQEREDNLDPI